ncbi:MAG: DUF748 domain-containing protein, partial [Gammaproteobacteria bacterium]|nr:DUF748 domain-containing protein [Gammaproteobacteria bacterium]
MKSFKELSKNRRRLAISGIVALSLIIVLVATPYIIQSKLTKLLLEMGAQEASIEDINLNPFSGVVEITGLSFSTAEVKNQKLAKLSLNVHLLSLFKKWIHLKDFTMDGLNLAIEIDDSGKPIIGGLTIPESPESDNKEEKESKPWGFGIDAIALSMINIDYRDPKLKSNLNIEELNIGELANWNGEQASPLSLKAKLNDNKIEFSGKALPFAKDPTFTGKTMIKQVELKPFAPFVPQLTVLSGLVSLNSTVELIQRADKTIEVTHTGEFKLEKLNVQNPDMTLTQEQLTWNGTFGLTMKEEQLHSSMDAQLILKGIHASSAETELVALSALSTTIKFD